jgi:tritrans,polycis-undecaprenyl-diphosphate synthase [geranylgeranyl-diphosphate specific]
MKLFLEFFEKAKNNKTIHDNKIRINFIGRIELFPKEVYSKMLQLMEATKGYSDYLVNFAMAYGGREEIVDAIKKIGRAIEAGEITDAEINEELVNKNVYMPDQPDFIIRTGGDHRTSNFLIWQSWYSEWFFLEKTWPEFEKEDLIACMSEFMQRERRFGK